MKYKSKLVVSILFFMALILAVDAGAGAKAKKKKISFAKAKVALSKTSYTYNGKARKPAVSVKIGKKKIKNKEYTVSYKNNKKAGTAKVTVTAKKKSKKYKGKKSKTFAIRKAGRKIVPGKKSYTAVEGDGAFYVSGKPSKGGGTVKYSCSKTDVIKVSGNGKVIVLKRGTEKVKMSVSATANYKAASATVTVTISKKPVRAFDSASSIKNYNYPKLPYACETKKLTDLDWSVVSRYEMPGLAPTADDDLTKGYIQCNNLCPQGLCFAGDYMLTTAYCVDKVHSSCVFIYDKKTGAFLRTLVLSMKSHVGGITYDGSNVWICHSASRVLQKIPYSALKKYADGSKKYIDYKPEELALPDGGGYYSVSCKPSSIAYNKSDGYLWVPVFGKLEDSADERTDEGGETAGAVMTAYEYKDGRLKTAERCPNALEVDYLGVRTETASGGACEAVGVASGASVSAVMKRDLVDVSGKKVELKVGDVIVGLGESAVSGSEDVREVLSGAQSGQSLKLTFLRRADGAEPERHEETVVLGERLREPVVRKIPNYVQGVAFTDTGKVIFSCSWGRNQSKKNFLSQLMIYDATWDWNGEELPIWKEKMVVVLPPMVEELEIDGDNLYMIFESAALNYLEGTDGKGKSECPIDKIVAVKLKLD